jgi:hypothetical protein
MFSSAIEIQPSHQLLTHFRVHLGVANAAEGNYTDALGQLLDTTNSKREVVKYLMKNGDNYAKIAEYSFAAEFFIAAFLLVPEHNGLQQRLKAIYKLQKKHSQELDNLLTEVQRASQHMRIREVEVAAPDPDPSAVE